MKTRSMQCLPAPWNSMSAISSPPEAATRSAISRTFCSSKAIFSVIYARVAAQNLAQLKSGLAPTGVLRQFLRTTTQQFSLPTIRLRVRKHKLGEGHEKRVWRLTRSSLAAHRGLRHGLRSPSTRLRLNGSSLSGRRGAHPGPTLVTLVSLVTLRRDCL